MKIACCARKLKGETRKIFTPPQEWACKAYALTQFSELSMVMEYETLDEVLGIRRLTPTECARLQTIPEWYKWECSDSQAYRMLGNGWTVEVIKHFFKELPFARERATESQRR